MSKGKVLLIGGSGYIGRHLAIHLHSVGFEVTISGTMKETKPQYITLDFSAPDTYKNLNESYDLVIVLVSKMNALGSVNLQHPDLCSNTIHYGGFLQYLADSKLANRFIYISSMTVYSEYCASPVVEASALNPLHVYGLSKVLAEKITEFFCLRNNIPGVVLRIPGVYGGNRQGGFIYNVIQRLKAGEEVQLNTRGLGYWETIHVDDLTFVITDFIEKYLWTNPYEIFNVSYGHEIDIVDTANYILRKIRKGNIITKGKKGYTSFFLSNEKIATVVSLKINFLKKLDEYIKSFECTS